jgi:hypothetical protein
MNVMNFFVSDYMPREHLKTITSLKSFLKDKKKFSNMLIDDKTQLNNFNPMHFFDHLQRLHPKTIYTLCTAPELNPQHFSLLPSFVIPAVFFTLILEAGFYLENVEINKEECKKISRELIKSVQGLKVSNQNIISMKIMYWCLEQMKDFIEDDFTVVMKKSYGKSSCLKIVTDPIDNIPLLMSHVFINPDINPIVSKTENEWGEVFSALALRDINGFDIQTRSFRNFCLNEWRNNL